MHSFFQKYLISFFLCWVCKPYYNIFVFFSCFDLTKDEFDYFVVKLWMNHYFIFQGFFVSIIFCFLNTEVRWIHSISFENIRNNFQYVLLGILLLIYDLINYYLKYRWLIPINVSCADVDKIVEVLMER